MAIGIAVLGAGDPAKEHLRAIATDPDFELRAVYSRSQSSAEKVASGANVDAYFDSRDPAHSLDALLARKDIAAVTIASPTPIQPEVIKKALRAEKHALSERPIAEDVQTAKALLEWYDKRGESKSLWSVGENFRFTESLIFGRKTLLENIKGPVRTFSLKVHSSLGDAATSRETPRPNHAQAQAGLILKNAIHLVAALRFLIADPSEAITQVTAFTSPTQGSSPPRETANTTIQLSSGKSGTFSIKVDTTASTAWEIEVTKERGTVIVDSKRVTWQTGQNVETRLFSPNNNVEREIAVFAQGIKRGKVESRGTPEEALEDLKVAQAILESAREGGAVKSVQ